MIAAREWAKLSPEQKDKIAMYIDDVPVKLGAIARELGVTVKLSTMKPGLSGHIQKDESGNYVIKINRHETRERQRFTLAHEISHFLLHKDIIDQLEDGIEDNVLYRSGAPERKEYEANRLAAEIVMPERVVKAKVEALGGPVSEEMIEKMAEIFQVSKAAMEIRLGPYID